MSNNGHVPVEVVQGMFGKVVVDPIVHVGEQEEPFVIGLTVNILGYGKLDHKEKLARRVAAVLSVNFGDASPDKPNKPDSKVEVFWGRNPVRPLFMDGK